MDLGVKVVSYGGKLLWLALRSIYVVTLSYVGIYLSCFNVCQKPDPRSEMYPPF